MRGELGLRRVDQTVVIEITVRPGAALQPVAGQRRGVDRLAQLGITIGEIRQAARKALETTTDSQKTDD